MPLYSVSNSVVDPLKKTKFSSPSKFVPPAGRFRTFGSATRSLRCAFLEPCKLMRLEPWALVQTLDWSVGGAMEATENSMV